MRESLKRWSVGSGLLVLFAAGPAWSRQSEERTLSPYFVVQGNDSRLEAFPLKSTQVVASVSGVVADVVVTQTYANEGSAPINARYVFPASTRAAVRGLTIRVGDQAVVARIRPREKARAEFADARRKGHGASLLEQQRPNVFSMDVANILPGEEAEVELRYTELLVPVDGIYQFVYPAVVGPRCPARTGALARDDASWVNGPHVAPGQGPEPRFDLTVALSTGIPLQQVESPSHRIAVEWLGAAAASLRLAETEAGGGDRDFILDYRLAGEQIQSGLLLHHGETERYFLMMVQPPERVAPDELAPREYVFVLDVSGSMDGFPLETARGLIRDLLGGLRPADRFNVILFAGGALLLAPASLEPTEANVGRALLAIEQQQAGGATELMPALRQAFGLPRDDSFSRSVVVITDGFVSAEAEVFELIRTSLNRASLFSFGIGTGVNRHLVEGMARAGQGEPFVVTRPEDAAAAAARFRRYIESPVLSGVSVAFLGFDAYDVEPPVIADLFSQRPILLSGRYRGDPAGEIEISGRRGARAHTFTIHVEGASPAEPHSALPILWARSRIQRLSDLQLDREDAQIRQQITRLGLAHSLLTPYTSFIAVLERSQPPAEEAADVEQPRALGSGLSPLAVGGGYAAGPEPELWILLLLVALLGLASGRVLRSSRREQR